MMPTARSSGVLGSALLRLLAALLVSSGVILTTGVAPAGAAVIVDAQPEPSWHVDGPVYATAIAGDTVVVGGAFANAVGPAGELVPRANLAAFSLSTGALLPGWSANADAAVRALVTDGTAVWAGGSFRSVGGRAKNRIVKLDLATGAVDATFRASTTNTVRALALRSGALYLGGNFGQVGGLTRPRIALVDPVTGAVDPAFVADVSNTVLSLATPAGGGPVYVGGSFTTISGAARSGVAALDGATGAVLPVVFTGATTGLGLDLTPDGSRLFGALGGSANAAVAWNPSTGARLWRSVADGDVQAVRYWQGSVYFGFHDGFAGDTTMKLLAADATTGALDPAFRPPVIGFWGIDAIAAAPGGIVVGGIDFTSVGGVPGTFVAMFHADRPVPADYLTATTQWRYLDQGVRPVGWESVGFDDSAWKTGAPQLGYGDGDETTVIDSGPSTARYVTAYFRASFEATGAPATLTLELAADDGAVVYLNGQEVLRDNMPAGAVGNTTWASAGRGGSAENLRRVFTLDPGLLHAGTNVLAVEVHQAQGGTSDATFDVRLTG